MPTEEWKPPRSVAIVGGGCAGLAAAWQLSRALPDCRISIYERSWRLGGKGASGRDQDGRIIEHGLHIWLGFYENAFRMMRQCYEEVEANGWGPRAGDAKDKLAHGSMDEAFFPEPHIGVAVRDATEDSSLDPARMWGFWSGYMPPAKGLPGEDIDPETNPFTLENYLIQCYQLLKTLILSVVGPGDGPVPGQPERKDRSALDAAIEMEYAYSPVRSPEEILDWSARLLRGSALTGAALGLQAVLIVDMLLDKFKTSPLSEGRTFQLMTAVLSQVRKLLCEVVAFDPVVRRKTEVIDIVITIAVGLYRDRVLFSDVGFDAINGLDYREWLASNGASQSTIDSEFITGIYDLTFAYQGGLRTRETRKLAAGVALRGALRMFFTYRGSMFWRMRSGMGDAVFAPLYKVLLKKGVKFHFLHELESLTMTTYGGQRYVQSLNFKTDGDAATLDALGDAALDHFGCWPNERKQEFKDAAAAAPGTLMDRCVTDFEAVVFATGVEDFLDVGDRSNFPKAWTDLRGQLPTAATQSVQVWLSRDLQQLGWYRGSGIMTALRGPFETWADMTHTLATERAWRAAKKGGGAGSEHDAARSVAYFCAVLADGDARTEGTAQAKVKANLDELLARSARSLWPEAFTGKDTAANLLVGTPHVQVNAFRSDRYTLSVPGTIHYRISPLDLTVMNMSVAGDWTASGLDAGCVEAAVMSGMLAAYAICNDAGILGSIVGYDHP